MLFLLALLSDISRCRESIDDDWDILIDCVTPDSVLAEDDRRHGGVVRLNDMDLRRAAGGDGAGADDSRTRELTDDNVQTLQAACEVVDALGPTVRRALIKQFNRKQLKNYGIVFHADGDFGNSLEGCEKRYSWFRRALRDVEAKYGVFLPKHWRVLHRMCIDFCEATRTDLDRILSRFDPPQVSCYTHRPSILLQLELVIAWLYSLQSAPAEALLRVLTRTIAFEKEMAKRFEVGDIQPGGGGASGCSASQTGVALGEDEDAEERESFDESAPLYNKKGVCTYKHKI